MIQTIQLNVNCSIISMKYLHVEYDTYERQNRNIHNNLSIKSSLDKRPNFRSLLHIKDVSKNTALLK